MTQQITAVTEPAVLGESPLWDGDRARLMWVDVDGCAVHEYDPATGQNQSTAFDVPVTAIVRRAGGGYVFAAAMGYATCEWPSTELTWVAAVDVGTRMNDGACDPAGRMLAGTMVMDEQPGAALYCLDRGHVRQMLDRVSISNGLDWSPDGRTMYYVDTPLERVEAFDYDVSTGALSGRRTLVDLHEVPGRPDGLTVDASGGVWIAMARGGASVRSFTPDGRPDVVIDLPVPNITSVAFGGKHLDDLYVTTSQLRLGPDDLRRWPHAGSLFRICGPGATGREPYRYVP